jgi:hypothetical protein
MMNSLPGHKERMRLKQLFFSLVAGFALLAVLGGVAGLLWRKVSLDHSLFSIVYDGVYVCLCAILGAVFLATRGNDPRSQVLAIIGTLLMCSVASTILRIAISSVVSLVTSSSRNFQAGPLAGFVLTAIVFVACLRRAMVESSSVPPNSHRS